MKRRVLLLLTETFANGGIQRFNRTLLTALETLGVNGDVFSFADTDAARAAWHRADSPLRIRCFARNRAAFVAAAAHAIASGRYDDVIVGHVHFVELAVNARVFRHVHTRLLMVAHGVEVWDRIRGARRRALRAIDKLLCVSEYTAQSIRAQAPEIPADHYAIFPNALADLWVEKMAGVADAPSPGRGPFLLAVARLSRHDRTKGIITALEAFAQLPRRELRFVVAGDGEDLPLLRQIAARLGVAERVEFVGAVSDAELVALYRACEAFVLPSGQEGFGIVFLEAMFFGAPVIAAREKGALDVVRDGETGLLVPYGDVVSLAAAIMRVLDDRALREHLRATARANVTTDGCFTATAFTRRLARILSTEEPPRKVVFVNRFFHPDESATSRMLSDLARRLSQAGTVVEVVTSRQLYDDPRANLEAHGSIDGVRIHRVGGAGRGRARLAGRALDYLGFHLAAAAKLRQILRAGDVVVAKTDPPLLSVSVARAARARRAVLVNWVQDMFPEVADELGMRIPQSLANRLRRWRNASLRQATSNVAIGARMAERLAAQGVPASSISIVPNWANLDEIVPHPRTGNPLRAQLGLTDEHFVIGYSGNLGRAHEYETFLEAATLLRGEPWFVFLVVGGGAKLAGLRREVATRRLTNFRFHAYLPAEQLALGMAASDVHLVSLLPELEGLIVPSKYYGIMAAGRPAVFIGDEDGEIAREIRASRTGFGVRRGEPLALADGLRRLHADPALVAELGANARAAAESRHSSQSAVNAWRSLLDASATQAAEVPLAARLQSGT